MLNDDGLLNEIQENNDLHWLFCQYENYCGDSYYHRIAAALSKRIYEVIDGKKEE